MSSKAHERRIWIVWLILIAATLASSVLGLEQGAGAGRAVAVVIIGVALVKVYLIGMYFMEVRSAPTLLRRAFQLYVVLVFASLCFIDLMV